MSEVLQCDIYGEIDWSTFFFFICLMQYSVISGIYSMYVHLNFEN